MNVFITGNNSGLGRGFTKYALEQGWNVYVCSRRGCDLTGVHDICCYLSDFEALPPALDKLLQGEAQLDLVIRIAVILGEIKPMHETSLLDTIMRHNHGHRFTQSWTSIYWKTGSSANMTDRWSRSIKN